MLFRIIRFAPDGKQGGDSSGGKEKDDASTGITLDDVRRVIRREGHGNVNRTIQHLLKENRKYRIRARKAEEELKDAAPEIKDGEQLLTVDEAKEWTEYKALGKKPTELKKSLDTLGELQAKQAREQFDAIVAEAADELGWNSVLLPTVLRDKNLAAEMKDVSVKGEDGKTTRVSALHVRPADKNDAPWELVDVYVERELASYLPALETPIDNADDVDVEEFDEGDEGDEEFAGHGSAPEQRPARPLARTRDSERPARNGAYGRRATGETRTPARSTGTRNARTNGARGSDGVPFPSQSPATRDGSSRQRLERAAAEKNRAGDYSL